MYIYQQLYPIPAFASLTWRQDVLLNIPILVGPRNNANLCFDTTFVSGTGTGVILLWGAVSGASFYVVQWCNNSSFTGPTLRSTKVTGATQYELNIGDDVRIGENVFWRVAAYDGSGGISPKSEVRQFIYDCPGVDGNLDNQNQQPGGGGGGGQPGALCSKFDVKLEVKGPTILQCCDKAMYHLTINWTCLDDDGNAVDLTGVQWEITQSGNTNVSIVGSSTNVDKVIVAASPEPGNDISEQFTLKAVATFTVVGPGTTFECSDQLDVTVDCDAGDKPGLQVDYSPHYGLITYMHEDYLSTEKEFFADSHNLVALGTLLEDGEGTIDNKHAIAVGPVIEKQEILEEYPDPYYPCDKGISRGRDTRVIHQAQVNIPLGCGLHVDTVEYTLGIFADDILGLHKNTSGTGDYCLYVEGVQADELGCGLHYYGGELKVYAPDLAGPGLYVIECEFGDPYCDENCELGVFTGCGLYIYEDKVQVYHEDLLGPGLYNPRDDCKLGVSVKCGIYIDEYDFVRIDPYLAGEGICWDEQECTMYIKTIHQELVTDVYCSGGYIFAVKEFFYLLDYAACS